MRPIPGNPGQNLTTFASSPEILKKTSQDDPFACWLLVGWFRQPVQRPPAGAIKINFENFGKIENLQTFYTF